MMPGSSEWLIILGVAILIFGPSKLPKLGGAIGEAVRNLKRGLKGIDETEDKAEKRKITVDGNKTPGKWMRKVNCWRMFQFGSK